MPIMDGFSLVAKIRDHAGLANLPVVALTSRNSPVDRQRGTSSGFSAYLPKFDRDAVLSAIDRALSKERPAS